MVEFSGVHAVWIFHEPWGWILMGIALDLALVHVLLADAAWAQVLWYADIFGSTQVAGPPSDVQRVGSFICFDAKQGLTFDQCCDQVTCSVVGNGLETVMTCGILSLTKRLCEKPFQISTGKLRTFDDSWSNPRSSQALPSFSQIFLFANKASFRPVLFATSIRLVAPGDIRTLGQWVAPPCFNCKVSDGCDGGKVLGKYRESIAK
eukprot:s1154_g9.t1